ncbi:acetyl-CoA carboxylase, carboxyltransferase subunit beta [candidate division WOR-3 bacterium]|nr:acetyl-CoA carboxylase, carboxyltransferase subunit beta [candidate division WOR-3 bacterium]
MSDSSGPLTKAQTPDGQWLRCDGCGEILYRKTLESNFFVCTRCGHHFRIPPDRYIAILLDDGRLDELDPELASADPLRFPKYSDKLKSAREATGKTDGFSYGRATIGGTPVVFGIMDFRFIGGSMGSVVGDKVARAARLAREERRPLVLISTSGGARMYEGIYSLMQMAKTSAELGLLRQARVPFISVPVDPCTAGVMASYASLGDVIISEPGALLGFAGARVIEGTIGEKLPEGFQRAEFMLKHGQVDKVVPRRDLKEVLARLLALLWPGEENDGPRPA